MQTSLIGQRVQIWWEDAHAGKSGGKNLNYRRTVYPAYRKSMPDLLFLCLFFEETAGNFPLKCCKTKQRLSPDPWPASW